MNTPISFELDKLLLSKNIDMPVNPTISDVVMWLYEKHGIWISVDVINNLFKYKILQIEGIVSKTFGNEIRCSSFDYNSPKEAYEAAIIYTLNHLI